MQPEQQNPTPQSNPNVPDFLQLDPIPDPAEQKHKKNKVVLIIFSILLVMMAGVAVLAATTWLQGESERRFYTMLDKLMQASYIERAITIENEIKDKKYPSSEQIEIKAVSDFSNPATPKSKFTYDYYARDSEKSVAVSGETVVENSSEFATKFEKYTIPRVDDIRTGQWYRVSSRERETYDPSWLIDLVNTTQTNVICGNFSDNQRQDLLGFIVTNNIYSIDNFKTEEFDGKEYTVYTVKLDYKQIAKLNEKLKDSYKLTSVQSLSDEVSTLEVWVDNNTNLPYKIQEHIKLDDINLTASMTAIYSFPDGIDIKMPDMTGAMQP